MDMEEPFAVFVYGCLRSLNDAVNAMSGGFSTI